MTATALAASLGVMLFQLPDSAGVMPRVPLGATVRIETSAVRSGAVEGTLVEKNQGFLRAAVARDVSVSVPWSRIATLSVSAGAGAERRHGVARGALAGVSAALVVSPSLSDPTAAVAAGVALPVAGVLLGWYAGYERWESVLWRPAIDSVMDSEATTLHVEPGAEVTVRVARRSHRGHVQTASDDSLTLRHGTRESRYAWDEVTELRVPDSRSRLRGAALGFIALAAASGVHILAAKPQTVDKQRIVISYSLGGALVGAAFGAPAWRRLPVPVR